MVTYLRHMVYHHSSSGNPKVRSPTMLYIRHNAYSVGNNWAEMPRLDCLERYWQSHDSSLRVTRPAIYDNMKILNSECAANSYMREFCELWYVISLRDLLHIVCLYVT